MARHLSPRDIESIISLIVGWKGKLTWDLLCGECSQAIGFSPTRQTLSSYSRIRHSFSAAKKAGGNNEKLPETPIRKPQSLRVAGERITRLEKEVERLKRENSLLLEQFIVWQQNCTARGLTINDLNQPLMKVDRERTED
jgi:hypothetical protein